MIASLLEDFSDPDAPPPTASRTEDLPGYEAGFSAGQAAANKAQTAIASELVAELQDVSFGFAEAQQALLAALAPMIEALVAQLLPDTIQARYLSELSALILEAAGQDLSQPVLLHIHPDQAAAVRELLIAHGLAGFSVLPDPALSPHAASISVGGRETALNVDDLTERLIRALGALTTSPQKAEQNG